VVVAGMEKKFAIYSRKSKFTGKGESIGNQIELCRQYIEAHNGIDEANTALIYEDEGISGATLNRPNFIEMMKEARTGRISCIICYRLDRISRNIGDFAQLIEELNHMGINFISIKEQFDTSSPMGRAMMYIASVFSQLERETIAERIRDNMHELAKTGRWLGGVTPTGYESESIQRVTIDGKVRKACKLKAIPAEAQIIQLIFEKFIETHSLTKTEAYLIQNGYTTKNGKMFTRFTIKNILINPVYMIADQDAYQYLIDSDVDLFSDESDFNGVNGIMCYNRTEQKSGRANRIRPMDEWIVSVGKHEGFISGFTWIRIQKLLETNKSKTYRKPRSHKALLSGLLICGGCGEYMRPKLANRFTHDGEQIYTYMCNLKERSRSHSCKIKNINGNVLDKAAIEEIKKISVDNSQFMKVLEKGQRALENKRIEFDRNLQQLQREIKEIENEIVNLVTSLSKSAGTIAEEYIIQEIDKRDQKKKSIQSRIDEFIALNSKRYLDEMDFDLTRNLLVNFKSTFDDMTIEQRRSAVRTFVEKIVWDGENVHIYFFGSNDNNGGDGSSITPPENDGRFAQNNNGNSGLNGNFDVPLGENSKRDIDVFPQSKEIQPGHVYK